MSGIQLEHVEYCFCKIVSLFLSLSVFQISNDDCICKCCGAPFKYLMMTVFVSAVVHPSNLEVHPNVVLIFVLQRAASRSLAALQQRRQQIISQLEKVVGKSAASVISSSAGSQARVVRTVLIANTVFSLTE